MNLPTLLQKVPDNEPANFTTEVSRQWTCQLYYKSFQTVNLPTLLQKFPDSEASNLATKVSRQWTCQPYYKRFQTMNLPTLLQKFPDSEASNLTTKGSRQWTCQLYYRSFQTVNLPTLLQKFPDNEPANFTTKVSRQWNCQLYFKSFQTMVLNMDMNIATLRYGMVVWIQARSPVRYETSANLVSKITLPIGFFCQSNIVQISVTKLKNKTWYLPSVGLEPKPYDSNSRMLTLP